MIDKPQPQGRVVHRGLLRDQSFCSRYLLTSLWPSSTLPWVAPSFLPFFFVRPVALRDQDLVEWSYGYTGARFRELCLPAHAEVYKGPLVPPGTEGDGHDARFVGAFLVGLAARLSGRSLYSLRSLELPATTVGEWRRRHSLRRLKAGPGPQL